MLSRFHLIPGRYGRTDGRTDGQTDGRTNGRTDGQTDRIAISISRVSVLTRDKNGAIYSHVIMTHKLSKDTNTKS